MSTKTKPKWTENLLSAISGGFFLILIGVIFAITPNLAGKIVDFFSDFTVVQVPNTTGVLLPAPATPNLHVTLYSAVALFSIAWGIYQIFLLVARFLAGSSLSKKAENASDIVFWLGVYYLINTFLNALVDQTLWFIFWGSVIMLLGTSLIVRAVVLAFKR